MLQGRTAVTEALDINNDGVVDSKDAKMAVDKAKAKCAPVCVVM